MKDYVDREEVKDETSLTPRVVLVVIVSLLVLIPITFGASIARWFLDGNINIAFAAPGIGSLGPVIILAMLINPLLKLFKIRPFNKIEMFMVYGALMMGAMAIDSMNTVVLQIPFFEMFKYQKTEVGVFSQQLSRLGAIQDFNAVAGFYQGNSSVPWRVWIGPILTWTLLLFVVFVGHACVSMVFRRRWEEHEHLRYPLVVPVNILSITASPDSKRLFWKDAYLWIGFALAFIFAILPVLNQYFPWIPYIYWLQLSMLAGRLLSGTIWSTAVNNPWFQLAIIPSVIGIGYLVDTKILFSTWFHFVLVRLINGPFILAGNWDFRTRMIPYEQYGSLFGLGLFAVWLVKNDAIRMLKDRHERIAVWGSIIIPFVLAGLLKFLFGVDMWVGVLVWWLYYLASITSTRMRAEAGIGLQTGLRGWFVGQIATTTRGRGLGISNLAGLSSSFVPIGESRIAGSMGNFLETFKLFHETKERRIKLMVILGVVFLVSIALSWAIVLPLIYRDGAWGMNQSRVLTVPGIGWDVVPAAMAGEAPSVVAGFVGLVVGIIYPIFLALMKSQFLWWPLEPIGYVITHFHGWYFATNFFFAWIIKALVLRYGGSTTYKRLMPVFVGLIIGHMTAELLGAIVGLIF